MTEVAKNFLEELNDDLISGGWLAYGVESAQSDGTPLQQRITAVLTELLLSEKVEVGETFLRPNYVGFTAWRGTVEERVSRALKKRETVPAGSEGFAFWICLRENIDRFEDELS